MKLQNAKITGFKSFKNLCRLGFSDGITAIVGPNGSGKSNIADAFTWAMGESSAKTIRGEKMEDVIFAGTTKHKALGYAEVTLEFDNGTISRRIYRSGDNEYLIDDKQCRKKDIDTLLFDTGLGRFGYSVIGQGKVASIISNNPQERKRIFEEATGIAKYKTRKTEAERELVKTDENIVRLKDIIIELEARLPSLESQSNRAKKYLRLYNTLKELDIYFSLTSLSGTEHESNKINENLANLNAELEQNEHDITRTTALIEELYKAIKTYDYSLLQKENELDEKQIGLSELKTQKSVSLAKKETINENDNASTYIEDLQRELEELQTEDNSSNISNLEKIISDLKQAQDSHNGMLENKAKLEKEIADLLASISALEHKQKILEQMESSYSGYNKTVKAIMSANLDGIISTVGKTIKTDKEYATAIDIAIGSSAQNIICDTQSNSKKAISYLKNNHLGRAVFLPLDGLNPNVLNINLNEKGILGLACDFVKCEYDKIADFLLGRTILAENIDDALAFFNKTGRRYRVITLSGEELRAGGAISGGSVSKHTSFFNDNVEILQIAEKINEYNKTISLKQKELDNLALEKDITEELTNKTHELELLNQKQKFYNQKIEDQLLKIKTAEEDSLEKFQKTESLENIIKKLDLDIKKYENEIKEIAVGIDNIKAERRDSEDKIKEVNKDKDDLLDRKLNLQKELDKLESKKEQIENATETVATKLWQEYEITIPEARKYNYTIKDFNYNEIASLKRELKELGNVNLEAIDEYNELYSRYDLLSHECTDLENSKAELLGTISTLTGQMEVDFRENFDLIAKHFSEIFTDLFDGGSAELSLDMPDDILSSGVDIKIQPPGKSLQSITLLSGGEKAMSAICVLFAILKVRPSPFCVLDEVDAALDDTNVTRFNTYLRKMADKTQFIVVTHKRGTMEMADSLYGVTMQEKGVSSLIKMEYDTMEEDIA